MYEVAAALAGAFLVGWLLLRSRPSVDGDGPDTELWGAFDRGEDPTRDA